MRASRGAAEVTHRKSSSRSGRGTAGTSSGGSGVTATEDIVAGVLGGSGPISVSHLLFLRTIAHELRLRDPDGSRLALVSDPAAVAREAAEYAVDTADTWTEHLGGFYDVDGVRRLLSRDGEPVTKQAVSKRRGLLALTTGSGRVVYPRFQFTGGGTLPGLAVVLHEVPEQLVSRWTLASWLVSPQQELGGDSPVQLLREGSVEPVVAAARGWAAALAA